MFRDTFDIYIAKDRTRGLATVGTLQTINMREGFFMFTVKNLIQLFRFTLLQLTK